MQFKVTQVLGDPKEWESRNGTMLTYKLWGSLDGGSDEMVQINTSKNKPKVPTVGEVIICDISKDDPQYGKSIRRVQEGGFQNSQLSRSPETQDAIMRQHATTDALSFLAIKASQMTKKQVLEISDTVVLRKAQLFFDYYKSGTMPVSNLPEVMQHDEPDPYADVEAYAPQEEI